MSLESKLQEALQGTVKAAMARNYDPKIFKRMLAEHGGLETAHRLLASEEAQIGLIQLHKRGLLGKSMEAVVLQEQFKSLFMEEELAEARQRLEDLEYYK